MKLLSNKKSFLTFIVIILIMGALSYFIFGVIKSKAQNVSLLDKEFEFQDEQGQYLISAQRKIEDFKDDITLVENSIIATDGHIAFIESIEGIARQNELGIEIQSLGFEENPLLSASGVHAFKIKAKAKGTWEGMYRFLVELESLPTKLQINKFSLTRSQSPSEPAWQADFELTTLKYK